MAHELHITKINEITFIPLFVFPISLWTRINLHSAATTFASSPWPCSRFHLGASLFLSLFISQTSKLGYPCFSDVSIRLIQVYACEIQNYAVEFEFMYFLCSTDQSCSTVHMEAFCPWSGLLIFHFFLRFIVSPYWFHIWYDDNDGIVFQMGTINQIWLVTTSHQTRTYEPQTSVRKREWVLIMDVGNFLFIFLVMRGKLEIFKIIWR